MRSALATSGMNRNHAVYMFWDEGTRSDMVSIETLSFLFAKVGRLRIHQIVQCGQMSRN
jgi:hypothetical protein